MQSSGALTSASLQPVDAALVLKSHNSDKGRAFAQFGTDCPTPRRVGPRWFPCKKRSCEVCGPRRARITARVIAEDAKQERPRYALTLTTRDPDTTAKQFARGCEAVWRALRREYGRVEYYGRIEFTTGRAKLSGGRRRIHVHFLVKGEFASAAKAEAIARRAWMNQNPGAWRVQLTELRTVKAALQYVFLHHAKPEQLPPAEWVGRVDRGSAGYFSESVTTLRERARVSLHADHLERLGRARWAAERIAEHRHERYIAAKADKRALRDALRAERLQAINVPPANVAIEDRCGNGEQLRLFGFDHARIVVAYVDAVKGKLHKTKDRSSWLLTQSPKSSKTRESARRRE